MSKLSVLALNSSSISPCFVSLSRVTLISYDSVGRCKVATSVKCGALYSVGGVKRGGGVKCGELFSACGENCGDIYFNVPHS
jgi:hypothetical protein